MAKTFMPELKPEQRLQLLKDNADRAEETTYYRPLTEEEMRDKHSQLADNLIVISKEEDALDKVKKEFKGKIDPKKAENKILLEEIKTRTAEVKGTLFFIADQDTGMMEVYTEEGELHSSRRLKPDEKQARLFIAGKAAND